MTLPPYFVHIGYGFTLIAFLARDVLVLRGLLMCAQAIIINYAFSVGIPTIAIWNSVFFCINIVYVIMILRDRRAVTLPAELKALYDKHFVAMSPGEFLKWWRIGTKETLHDGRLASAGTRPASLYFVLDGTVRVSREHQEVTNIPGGSFVAEMSLLTGHPANADADAVGEVTVMRWPTAELKTLRERNPSLWTKIQSVIGNDLVEKIRRGEHPRATTHV